MLFYKVKNNETTVCFRTDEVLYATEEVVKYAMENGLIEKSDKSYEVYTISSDEYREYMLKKISNVFDNHLEEIKKSWQNKSSDEICDDCQKVVYISDIINVLCDTSPSFFDFEGLEAWASNPDKIVELLCKRLEGHSSSDYNESICDCINQGLEE